MFVLLPVLFKNNEVIHKKFNFYFVKNRRLFNLIGVLRIIIFVPTNISEMNLLLYFIKNK